MIGITQDLLGTLADINLDVIIRSDIFQREKVTTCTKYMKYIMCAASYRCMRFLLEYYILKHISYLKHILY